MENDNKLNPQAKDVEIGIRSLRTIKIYPLSIGGQMDMSSIIAKVLGGFLDLEDATQLDMVNMIFGLVNDNLKKVLELAIDENEDAEKILYDCSNDQALKIVDLIIEVNYSTDNLKNVKGLFEKVKPLFLVTTDLEKSSPQSVKDMDTESETSSNHSEEAV